MRRRIALLIYPGFQLLDAAGPIAAFEIADRCQPGSYTLTLIAPEPGLIASSSGVALHASRGLRSRGIDTLIISGGDGSRAASMSDATRRFVRNCGRTVRRVASVCTGTYVLAAAGMLDGRRATTHWSRSADFKRKFPNVRLDPDRIFVKDGRFWTSAGISAGIDLALALISEDLGERIARRTARQLVVYFRRPGGQSQFSELLEMGRADGRFAGLLDYIRGHLNDRLGVDDLAQWSRMSPRHFARRFKDEVGVGPAKVVERLRVDAAGTALEGGERSLQRIAVRCGFGSAERMRRSFLRVLGTSPAALKRHLD